MTLAPARQIRAPAASQRSGCLPSAIQSHAKELAIVNTTVGGKRTACMGNIDASQAQSKKHEAAGSDQAPPGRTSEFAARPKRRNSLRSQRTPPSKRKRLFAFAYNLHFAHSAAGSMGGLALLSINRRNSCVPSGPDTSNHNGPPPG
jgi:hypothetical protein